MNDKSNPFTEPAPLPGVVPPDERQRYCPAGSECPYSHLDRIADLCSSVDALEATLRGLSSNWTSGTSNNSNLHRGHPAASEGHLLSEQIDVYLQERRAAEDWGDEHYKICKTWLEDFSDACPAGTLVEGVTRNQVLVWRDSLKTRKTNRGQQRTPQTINKCLIYVGAFFRWAKDVQGWIERDPTHKTKLKTPRKLNRLPFSEEQVIEVFRTLKQEAPTPAHYWFPLVLLFTGARPEEIAQMKPEEVDFERGCFDLRAVEDDKGTDRSIKTRAGYREIPIHAQLLNMGFKEETLAFLSTMTPDHKGKRASKTSRWFNKRLRRMGYKENFVLYSLRHTMEQELKLQGVPEAARAQILGHENHSITSGTYGDRYPLEQIRALIERVEYPSI